eukprot:9481266-Pyramimonas_sp.AAC.1
MVSSSDSEPLSKPTVMKRPSAAMRAPSTPAALSDSAAKPKRKKGGKASDDDSAERDVNAKKPRKQGAPAHKRPAAAGTSPKDPQDTLMQPKEEPEDEAPEDTPVRTPTAKAKSK